MIQIGQITINFLKESADTNGTLAMFEFTVPVGARVPLPHSHSHFDETIYGVEGLLTLTVAGTTIELAPGASCFIPRGAIHGFQNLHQSNAKALAVVTPALIGPDFFRAMAAVVNAGRPDPEKLRTLMLENGLVPNPAPETRHGL